MLGVIIGNFFAFADTAGQCFFIGFRMSQILVSLC